jgi:dolichyl-phosphate beta-glucosyltransferase
VSEPIFLSVVIPCYREAERLRKHVPGLIEYLRVQGRSFEIVVVDDGSPDDTAAVARTLPVRLISYQPNRGKGGAVKEGMLAAQGRYVLFTDADQSTPISDVTKLLAKLEAGYDVAIGSRAVPGAEVQQPQAFHRALAGKLFGLGTKLLCIRGIQDTQCGFKAMTRQAAQKVFPQVTSDSAIFDIEMLVVAVREGYRIAEVPVAWVHDPDTRIPYNFRRALRIWAELFRIRRAQNVHAALRALGMFVLMLATAGADEPVPHTVPGQGRKSLGRVEEGAQYWFEATGRVGINVGCNPACSTADPDGNTLNQDSTTGEATAADDRFPCPGLRTHSLVGKINGHCVQLGRDGSFTAPANGELIALCNDDIVGDNTGSWIVKLTPGVVNPEAPHELRTSAGDVLRGRLTTAAPQQGVTWSSPLLRDLPAVPMGLVTELRFAPTGKVTAAPQRFQLIGGDELRGTLLNWGAECVRVRLTQGETVEVRRAAMQVAILSGKPVMKAEPVTADVVLLTNGDRISGQVAGMTGSNLVVMTEFARLELSLGNVAAIRCAPVTTDSQRPPPTVRIQFADGGRVATGWTRIHDGVLVCGGGALLPAEVQLAGVRRIEFLRSSQPEAR